MVKEGSELSFPFFSFYKENKKRMTQTKSRNSLGTRKNGIPVYRYVKRERSSERGLGEGKWTGWDR